jgi:class 3 adenylate cyclase
LVWAYAFTPSETWSYLAHTHRFERYVVALISVGLLFTTTANVVNGGVTVSGAGMMWAFLTPVYAIIALGPRPATKWFVIFLVALLGVVVIDPLVSSRIAPPAYPTRLISFLVSTAGPTAITFLLLRYTDLRRREAQARSDELRERVDRLLHQYLSPEVASGFIADPQRAALGGVEAEVTVLFADLRGYTAYAEPRSPAEVVTHLNAAFGQAVPIILRQGGTVVQFMGDALMAIFNAPNPQPDHALRAARAALAMQQAVRNLPDAGSRPQFRVGLNSGLALVGNIGAAEIRNFSAIGDTTNLAARLQTYAEEGTVVIGASTYDLIKDWAIVRPLGAPALKGKSQAVEVYELLFLRE